MSKTFDEDAHNNYKRYRGKCKEYCERAVSEDGTLRLVRGHYYCPIWNTEEPHWWTVKQDGSIYDPTKLQFPSAGLGAYVEFDGYIDCSNCGKTVKEEDATFDSNYAFCSYRCNGEFVGVF